MNDGKISGYVKPLAQDIKVVNWEKDKKNPFNLVWQGIVGVVVEFFENQKEDQFATKVPLQGDLKNIESGVWPTIWNVFRNAFVQAFERNTDNTVKFSDKLTKVDQVSKPTEEKSRKEKRKERRKERKEERERKKEARKKEEENQG